MEAVGKLQTYTFILDVQSEHLPEFWEVFELTHSWISAFTVLAPKAGQLVIGAPTVRVIQPPYDERNKDLQVVVKVNVMHESPGTVLHS